MTATAVMTEPSRDPGARIGEWFDRRSGGLMIMPAVVILLAFAIFPLITSAYLALTRFALSAGGFDLRFIGLRNFRKLLFGSQQYHFLGTFGELGLVGGAALALVAIAVAYGFVRYLRGARVSAIGVVGRLIAAALALAVATLFVRTVTGGGFPGSLGVTIIYVVGGVAVQFALGLGLALLCARPIRARNFFRVVFFVPLMVTPVGIAYAFRMLADTDKGPFAPIWRFAGFQEFAWATDPWSARLVVMIGDTWQWTPFLFLVLLAAIENQPREQMEAATIDGASSYQVFRDITWPAIAPVAATIVLIRLIEAFKIIDLPNVLTNGGPGIATESMTLHAFIAWRTLDLGGSAAVGYMLLFVTTVTCLSFFHFVVRRTRVLET